MADLPLYIAITFEGVVLVTLAVFFYAITRACTVRQALLVMGTLVLWSIIQSGLALRGFYQEELNSLPPRFLFILPPTLLVMIALLSLRRGRAFLDRLPLVPLTYLSAVRVAVEVVLYWLFLYETVPELMTFAGRNFDILAGLTAPLIAYFGLQRSGLNRSILIAWNSIALSLLLFIIANAVLSLPTPLQQLAFDQPNVAILYFPFVLLPAVVAPIVLFTHVVSLWQLRSELSPDQ